MKRGTLCWVNLEDASPPELGKLRPGIVVSNTVSNLQLETVVIVPVSSKPDEVWPLRLRFQMPDGRASFAVVPGIRQVSKRRLTDPFGVVSAAVMGRIEEAIKLYLAGADD